MGCYKIQDFRKYMKNPEKYVGTGLCTLRSGWEIKFATWLDNHPSVVQYSSEEIVVPYFLTLSDGSKKKHRYFIDFWMRVEQEDGSFKEYLIEVKPQKEKDAVNYLREGILPPAPKRKTKRYYRDIMSAQKNLAKWDASLEVCKQLRAKGRDIQFLVLTEKDLPV